MCVCVCVCVCVCIFHSASDVHGMYKTMQYFPYVLVVVIASNLCIISCKLYINGRIVNLCINVIVTMFNSHTYLKDNLIFLINHESKAFKSGNCEYPHATHRILRISTDMEHKMNYGVK